MSFVHPGTIFAELFGAYLFIFLRRKHVNNNHSIPNFPIHFRVSEEINTELHQIASSNNISIGRVCKKIIENYVKNKNELQPSNHNWIDERRAYTDLITRIFDIFILKCTPMSQDELVVFHDLIASTIQKFVNKPGPINLKTQNFNDLLLPEGESVSSIDHVEGVNLLH